MNDDDHELWVNAVRSPASRDRVLAAFMLGREELDQSSVLLLRTALQDEDAEVRDFAAAALGTAKDDESLPEILKLLETYPPSMTIGAAWAVAQLASSADPPTRQRAIEVLHAYRRRARGFARAHADELLKSLSSSPS